MTAPIILVEVAPRRAADGTPILVRLAGGGRHLPYRYGGAQFFAGLFGLPSSKAKLGFDGDQLGGKSEPQAMELTWSPAGGRALAELAGLVWTDAPIAIRIGAEGVLPPIALQGLVLDTKVEDGVLSIALADEATDLRRPVLLDRFAGTGGMEGPADWEGRIKTRSWGLVFNVPGQVIDTANEIWCFGDPSRPWLAFDAVRDRGVPADADRLIVLGAQGSPAATFAALQAAQAPEGGGVCCPSIACVKWWTTPSGDLRADVRGETDGGYVATAAEIAQRIVAACSAIGFSNGAIAAAAAARPAPFGWRVADENATADVEISELLAGVSLSWVMSGGAIDFRRWEWTASTRVARSVSVTRRTTFKPLGARRIGYRLNQSPMSRGDLAAIVLARDVEMDDGASAADAIADAAQQAIWDQITGAKKPADYADVTRSNVAAGFAGQGALATLSSLANGSPYLSGFGGLSSLSNVAFGTGYLLEQSGGVSATLPAFKTSLGVASAIASQGPGATASADQVLNNSTEGVVRIARPVGGGYGTQTSQVSGALKVRLPVSWTATMMRMRIEVYEYSTGATSTFTVSGYSYPGDTGQNNPQWINTAAQMVGPDNRRRTVRFGHDGTKCAIWIGEAGDTWSYPQVRVLDFFAGFNPVNEATWASGWTVTFDTGGAQSVTSTIATPNAGESVFGVNMLEQRGGALATLSAFKTLLGIASGIAGQGALATLSSLANGSPYLSGFGYLSGTDRIILGTQGPGGITNNANTQWLTELALITSLGQAASISGQGPGATAAADQVLNNSLDGVVRIARPVGAGYGTQTSQVAGALKVRLPQSWTGTMMRMRIEVYEYSTGATSTFTVSGYNYPGDTGQNNPQWINTAAQMVGPDDRRRTVRFGHDGTKCCVWIGEAGDVWSYPQVRVLDFYAGFNPVNEAAWATGWSIAFDSGGARNVTSTIATPNAGESVFGVNMLEQRGGSLASLPNFKTSLGTAAGILGQGPFATTPAGQSLDNSNLFAMPSRLAGAPSDARYLSSLQMVYTTGVTVQSRQPDEAGANVTEYRTAASIAGQGPGATATGEKVLNNYAGNGVLRIARPIGGSLGTSGTVGGPLKIKLPQSWTATMVRFEVEIYEYGSNASATYTLGGYTHTGQQWLNTTAQMVGPDAYRRPVSFGHDGQTCCIWIGKEQSTWQYPQIGIKNFVAGYSAYIEGYWDSGWVLSIGGAPQNVSSLVSSPNSGEARYGSNILESPGVPATLNNFKTSQGTAAGILGQGAFATAGQLNSGNVFGAYFAQNAFSLGYTITRSDGTSIVTESLAITSYGIAAGFIGQAALATKNTVGANDSDMGLTGQAAVYSNDNRQTFNSTDYQACAAVTLTPQQGQPVKGRFTAILTDISGTSTQQYIRVRRDDGTVVKYGSGLLVAARDEGETCAIDFIDSVSAGRQTTWYVEVAKKAGANHAIAVDGAFLHVEETSRNQYQNVTIIAPSGTGAGAGSGGGGNVNGSGGGFGCPEVDEPFLLANADRTGPGKTIPAGQVRAGMFAWTRHERTGEWGAFLVSYTCIKSDEIWQAPGRPRTSPSHQFINEDRSITEMHELGTFERMGEVVAFHVDDARTYVVGAARAWSHNKSVSQA